MANKARKILVVDDDAAIADALSMMLEMQAFDVVAMTSGDAIAHMKQFQPDLLLLDIWMNGVDGRDICRKIKNDDTLKQTPVVLISASRDLATSAKSACADDFLEKPFDLETLLAKIDKHTS